MKWKYSVVQHAPRIALELSLVEYVVLDTIYKSQTHPDHNVGGWASISYSKLGAAIGLDKSSLSRMMERLCERGLAEINPIDHRLKQATSNFYNVAYLDPDQLEDEDTHAIIKCVAKRNVAKRNDSVAKRNDSVAKRNDSVAKRNDNKEVNNEVETKEEGKGATRTTATSKGFAYLGEMADRLTPLLESGQVDIRAAFSAAGIEPTVPQIRQHIAEWWSYCQQQNTRVARADEYAQWRHFRDRWIPNITSPTIRRKAGDKEPRRTFDNEYYAQFENEL